jgi:hypothetical protein
LEALGASSSFSTDPLNVIINSLRSDFNRNGTGTDDANNAAYLNEPCGDDIPRCLVFLRPAVPSEGLCVGIQLYDLAREALVIAHEYQHYVTDLITRMVPGTLSKAVVGDALHEGYSDYLAASHVSAASGSSVSKVGEYAFQYCKAFVRDVSVLRVYTDNLGSSGSDPTSDADPHNSGLSWASGLWKLRDELGVEKTDLIVMGSLFYLSTKPSFVEAVEALVQADGSLNGGNNSERIRNLFYTEVKFLGSSTDVFRDPARGIVEVGLRGCAHGPSGRGSFGGAGFLWLCVVMGFSRLAVRRRIST